MSSTEQAMPERDKALQDLQSMSGWLVQRASKAQKLTKPPSAPRQFCRYVAHVLLALAC